MKLYYNTFAATIASLAVSPASSSMLHPPGYNYSLPALDTEKMHADFSLLSVMKSHHHQRMLQEGAHEDSPDLSQKCFKSQDLLWAREFLDPAPELWPGFDEETLTLDYAADQSAFDAWDSHCNSLGGQTVSFDFEISDGCEVGIRRLLNAPVCFGSACDEDDIDALGNYLGHDEFGGGSDSSSCTVSFTAETDGDGEPFGPPCMTDECFGNSLNIFESAEVYGWDWWTAVIEYVNSGEYTEEFLANFEETCENESGRALITTVTTTDNDVVGDLDCSIAIEGIPTPTCFAKSCGDEARFVEELIFELFLEFERGCDVEVTVTVEGGKSSKSTKSSESRNMKSKKCKVPKSLRKGRK